MSAAVPTVEPAFLTAGDTLVFTKALGDYLATDGWGLSYYFQLPDGTASFNFSATTSGSGYSVTVAAATTIGWQPGTYSGIAKVALSSQVFTVWEGTIIIQPNLAVVGDNRSIVKKTLDALDAVLTGRAGDDILDSVVEGTVIRRLPISQIILLHDRYKAAYQAEVAAARLLAGKQTGRNIYARVGIVGPFQIGIAGGTIR